MKLVTRHRNVGAEKPSISIKVSLSKPTGVAKGDLCHTAAFHSCLGTSDCRAIVSSRALAVEESRSVIFHRQPLQCRKVPSKEAGRDDEWQGAKIIN